MDFIVVVKVTAGLKARGTNFLDDIQHLKIKTIHILIFCRLCERYSPILVDSIKNQLSCSSYVLKDT